MQLCGPCAAQFGTDRVWCAAGTIVAWLVLRWAAPAWALLGLLQSHAKSTQGLLGKLGRTAIASALYMYIVYMYVPSAAHPLSHSTQCTVPITASCCCAMVLRPNLQMPTLSYKCLCRGRPHVPVIVSLPPVPGLGRLETAAPMSVVRWALTNTAGPAQLQSLVSTPRTSCNLPSRGQGCMHRATAGPVLGRALAQAAASA